MTRENENESNSVYDFDESTHERLNECERENDNASDEREHAQC